MTEPTPIDLPVGLRWVKLVYRLGTLVTDSTIDADPHPDLLPKGGTLELTATPDVVRIQEADGRWRSVDIAGRTYTIRADGELVDGEGRVGVWIPDPASLLVEPQGYAITAVVKPTTGKERRVTIGGSTVLPDVVDLVAVSSVGSVSPSVTASFDARIYSLEQGGGVDVSQVVEDYLVANPPAAVADATTTTKGILQLAGDLAGTATAPTVPGLASKADATHDHTAADIDSGAALDGHVLTANGAGGAAWESPPAGGSAAETSYPLTRDGWWHASPYLGAPATSAFAAHNIAWCAPFAFGRSITVSAIGWRVSEAADAGAVYRLGLYRVGADGYELGTLVEQTTIPADTGLSNSTWTLTTPETIPAGEMFWVAVALQGAPSVRGKALTGSMLGAASGLAPLGIESGASWNGDLAPCGLRFNASGAFTSAPSVSPNSSDGTRFPWPVVRLA